MGFGFPALIGFPSCLWSGHRTCVTKLYSLQQEPYFKIMRMTRNNEIGAKHWMTLPRKKNQQVAGRWPLRLFIHKHISSVQLSSVAQSCPTLCDSMDCSTAALPVHHQRLDFTQTHVPWVSDAIKPPYPLSSPSPPAFNPSQQQGLFKWVSSSHQVAKVLEFELQHQSFQRTFRTDFL